MSWNLKYRVLKCPSPNEFNTPTMQTAELELSFTHAGDNKNQILIAYRLILDNRKIAAHGHRLQPEEEEVCAERIDDPCSLLSIEAVQRTGVWIFGYWVSLVDRCTTQPLDRQHTFDDGVSKVKTAFIASSCASARVLVVTPVCIMKSTRAEYCSQRVYNRSRAGSC